jgi:hypothetical protein
MAKKSSKRAQKSIRIRAEIKGDVTEVKALTSEAAKTEKKK